MCLMTPGGKRVAPQRQNSEGSLDEVIKARIGCRRSSRKEVGDNARQEPDTNPGRKREKSKLVPRAKRKMKRSRRSEKDNRMPARRWMDGWTKEVAGDVANAGENVAVSGRLRLLLYLCLEE